MNRPDSNNVTRTRVVPAIMLTLVLLAASYTAPAADTHAAMESSLLQFADKFYAITLTASYTKQADEAIQRAFPDLVLYQTYVNVADTRLNFRRLGFFATRSDAEAALPQVRKWYPDAWITKVTPAEQATALSVNLDRAIARQPSRAPAAPAVVLTPTPQPFPTPPSVTPSSGYALELAVGPRQNFDLPTLPPDLKMYLLYVRRVTAGQRVEYHLTLGIFDDRSSVERARERLLKRYPGASVRQVTPDEKARVAKLQPSLAAPIKTPPATADDSTTRRADTLVNQARSQISARQYSAAIKTLVQVLVLPKNAHTGDAVALTGTAYDRAGQKQQAILYYQTYLRVYPNGTEVTRVNQRLQALLAAPAAMPARATTVSTVKLYQPQITGTFSQFYRRDTGLSNTATAGQPPNLVVDTRSTLTTSINSTASLETERFENRFVLRDTNTYIHAPTNAGYDLPVNDRYDYFSDGYYELKDKQGGHALRIGRQTGTMWGLSGRYDGAQVVASITPSWRLGFTAAIPEEFNVGANRKLYGAAIDVGPLAAHWWGNLYYIHQEANDILDREAVGTEVRYADARRSLYSLFDYDTAYQELNVGVLQMTWRATDAFTYNALVDHRLVPPLQTTNAVNGNLTYNSSLAQLQASGMSETDIRRLALDRSIVSNNYTAGVTWQLNNKWQLGTDARMYNTGGMPAMDMIPATPGSGNVYVYSIRARRSGLFSQGDFAELSASHKEGSASWGDSLSLTNTLLFGPAWTVDTRVIWSRDHSRAYYNNFTMDGLSETTTDSVSLTPSIHVTYRVKKALTLEAEYGYGHSTYDSDTFDTATATHSLTHSDNKAPYFTLGYRWNF